MAKGILIAAFDFSARPRGRVPRLVRSGARPRATARAGLRRLRALDRQRQPEAAVATYELDSLDVLRSDALPRDRLRQSVGVVEAGHRHVPAPAALRGRADPARRRRTRRQAPGALLVNAMSVDPAHEAEFNEWYDSEHIPALAAVPARSPPGGSARARARRAMSRCTTWPRPRCRPPPSGSAPRARLGPIGCDRISATMCGSSHGLTRAGKIRR